MWISLVSRANADTKSQRMQVQAFEWVQFPHYYSILQMSKQVYGPLQVTYQRK